MRFINIKCNGKLNLKNLITLIVVAV